MGGSTQVGVAEECLIGMGYGSGVRGVVRRFHEHAAALQELALRWHPQSSQSPGSEGECAVHPNGLFILEVDAAGTGRLAHLWSGRGYRILDAGRIEDLRSEALRILRRGGPFGGPTIARKGEQVVQVREPHSGMRVSLNDGSETRVILVQNRTLGVRIWPDGKFAQMPLSGAHDDPGKVIEDDAEHLSLGSTRTPWLFTDLHPLVGTIRADPYDLLLCALRADLVGLFALKGDELLGLKVGPWDEIRSIDAGPWLEGLPASAPRPNAKNTAAGGAAPQEAPAADKKSAGPAATDKGESAPKRRKRVATSPGGMPGPRTRRVRLKPALAAAITQHLASVGSGLPAAVLGAAFAVELLRALEAGALSDLPTFTGKTVELFSRLHKKGLISSIPADQAGRAALKLLAERTPLVRRLHYRRWCFAFGDFNIPASALRARLGPIPIE